MAHRKHIPLREKLAAALAQMLHDDGTGKLVRVIPYDDAKKMSADQIISLFHWDHGIHHEAGGSDEHWNLTPLLIKPHRKKTATVDVPAIAKGKRIRAGQEAFRRRLLAKDTGEPPQPPRRWAKRKIQSRNTLKRVERD